MRRVRCVAAVLVLTVVASACGSDSDTPSADSAGLSVEAVTLPADTIAPSADTTTPTADSVAPSADTSSPDTAPTSTEGSTASAFQLVESADLAAEVERLYVGTWGAPPTDGPAAAVDKNVWVISCGEAAAACAQLAAGAVDAAETIGWNVTLFDGKFGADGAFGSGVRQAVAAGADAIIVGAIDCAAIAQPLADAKAAGIVLVSIGGYDCDDERLGGGEPLFDATVFNDDDLRDANVAAKMSGRDRALWLLERAGTSGLEIISFQLVDSLVSIDLAAGFEEQVTALCADCTITTVEFASAEIFDIGTKVADAMAQHPGADAIVLPFDSFMLLGGAQAVDRSGRSDEIEVLGGEGNAANLELIASNGGQDFAYAGSLRWNGWGAVDTVNRLFAGQEPVAQGGGQQFVDGDHPVEHDEFEIVPPVDYRALYAQAWGVQ